MRRTVIALLGALSLALAAVALGGCGHWYHGHCGSHSHAAAGNHHHGPCCGPPQGQ